MNIQNLINNLQQCQNSQAEVEFRAMFEVGARTEKDDFDKQITLKFSDCEVYQQHPSKVTLTLT